MVSKQIKYSVIYHYRDKYPVTDMCKYWRVSRSGYYDWIKRIDRPDPDRQLANLILKGYALSKCTYGYRRIKLWLRREHGLIVNHKAVIRIMRKLNIQSVARRRLKYKRYSDQFHRYDNVLNRDFSAMAPNQKWVTDITYIHTKQGVLYLSVIKDLFDGFIVAWHTESNCSMNLVLNTVRKAVKKEKIADGLVLHSDQGFQYTSHGYYHLTKDYGLIPSMSRRGNPYDNASMENFFGHLKEECIRQAQLFTYNDARTLVEEYIDFYNYERIQLKTKLTPYEKRCQLE